MSKKEEYIKTICEKLEACHYKTVDYEDVLNTEASIIVDGDSYEVKSFKWLPEENLKQLAEFNFAEWATWERAYQELGRKKILQFKPYIAKYPDKYPNLVLRHNKFLHMFRGYYYQTSMTIRGEGDLGHGCTRIDGLLRANPNKMAQISKLYYMLFYAALIDCGFKYDTFRNLFREDVSVVDTFLKESLEYYYFNTPFTWKDLEVYITTSNEPIIPLEHEHTFEIPAGNGILCRFYIDKESIGVEYKNKGDLVTTCKTLRIPGLYGGMTVYNAGDRLKVKCELNGAIIRDLKIDEDDIEEFNSSLENCQSWFDGDKERCLLVMLLNLCGIHMNWGCAYAIEDLEIIPRTNASNVISVDTLNDVKFTKEEA